MMYVFKIFRAKSMHEPSMNDECISTVLATCEQIASIVRGYNELNNEGYFYFVRM